MPEDLDGYIVDTPGHFYRGPQTTSAMLTELARYYPDVGALNAAISDEWRASGYSELRMGAAERLLARLRAQ